MSDPPASGPDFSGSGPVHYRPARESTASAKPEAGVAALLAREEARLFALPGVVSVGVGFGPAGGEALIVGVADAATAERLPRWISGVPVLANVTGPIEALPR